MGTKDRLAALRAQAQYTPGEDENSSVVVMFAGVKENLSVFENEVDKLKRCLEHIETNMNKIVKLYSVDLNNFKVCEDNKPIIEELKNEININSNKIRNKLKEFDDELEHLKKKGQIGVEFRIKKNLHSYVLNTFINLMTKYNDIQIEYRAKCKKRIQTELEITGKKVSEDELERMIESNELEVFTQNYQIDSQKTKQAIDDLKKRRTELEKIERSINQLHQLFVQMATLVEHQGTLVDSIEQQVSNAKEYAVEGVQQTNEALEHHKSMIQKKFCCYTVLIVIIVLFVIYAIFELK